ncbi:MAG: class I SAM-dependent methyltransferase [Bacteroidota bacterium]
MKTRIEWNAWGRVDPLYGVAAWEGKSKGGSSPWKDDEFYALGKSDWRDFKRHWDHFGVRYGTCVEIGCGAGRITRQLAEEFNQVKALDVSEAMIAYARSRIPNGNVEFILADGIRLPFSDRSVDAVFSTHVFQHFDSLEDAHGYFNEIFRVMNDHGSLLIHLPVYRWPGCGKIHRLIHAVRGAGSELRAAFDRSLIRRGLWRPLMRHLPFEIGWLFGTLDSLGFTDAEIRIIRVKSNNGEHPFVLARKRG